MNKMESWTLIFEVNIVNSLNTLTDLLTVYFLFFILDSCFYTVRTWMHYNYTIWCDIRLENKIKTITILLFSLILPAFYINLVLFLCLTSLYIYHTDRLLPFTNNRKSWLFFIISSNPRIKISNLYLYCSQILTLRYIYPSVPIISLWITSINKS